ncbi:MAG: hypothetical protein A3H96_07350 [Acidobacteria bacterium RIFCSPLOWO2_02_FULL_67_36]|nr:MAG: hypothetical protein A3H96_07350 [Acidobacteria bacterium RIFCSPLOWO2_02_FULL_67_36]OFW22233.1 MAG: hypothetical protein A3G21_20185 [Acidobacteria bacterium RIFCSPLOWO2_12_FULL_66_21]
MMSSKPFNDDVTHDVVCVLYAQGTGQIVSVHRFITLGDARPPREEDIEGEARRILQTPVTSIQARPAGDLGALIVATDAFERGRSYAVDCGARTLIERPQAPATTD